MHNLFRDPCILLACQLRGNGEALEGFDGRGQGSLAAGFRSALDAVLGAHGGTGLGFTQHAFFARFEREAEALAAGLDVLGHIHRNPDFPNKDRKSSVGVNVALEKGVEGPSGRESVLETLNGPVASKCLKMLSLCFELKVDFLTTTAVLQDEALGRDFFASMPKPNMQNRYAGTVLAGENQFELVYEVFAHNTPAVMEYKRKSARPLTHAINLVGQNRFPDAYQILVGLQRTHGALAVEDTVLRYFLERCRSKMEGLDTAATLQVT
jgi:hypothetical protein